MLPAQSAGRAKRPDRFCPTVWVCQTRPQDAATARRILLDGMARGTGVFELAGELAPSHPRAITFPGEVLLQAAADALEWCAADRADPLALEGMPERFLPECAFRGRQNKKVQFAVLAAAALRGGTDPDLLGEVAWWQTDDFWQYALWAAVAYVRAAASRAGAPGIGPPRRTAVRMVTAAAAQADEGGVVAFAFGALPDDRTSATASALNSGENCRRCCPIGTASARHSLAGRVSTTREGLTRAQVP